MVSFYLSCLASRKTVNSITQRGAIEVVGVPPNIVLEWRFNQTFYLFFNRSSTKHTEIHFQLTHDLEVHE